MHRIAYCNWKALMRLWQWAVAYYKWPCSRKSQRLHLSDAYLTWVEAILFLSKS